jgi:phage-related minor tail protein
VDTTDSLMRGIERVMNVTIGNLSKIVVAIVKYAVDAINGRKGGGNNWLKTAFKLVVNYYTGGAASAADSGGSKGGYPAGFSGGGLIPAYAGGGLIRVGEEGPELVRLPGGSEVINRRQQTYRRMDQVQQVTYSPNYNIVIENAGDAKEAREQLSSLLALRDRRLKSELVGMLKDNGFGRMR